MTKGRDNTAESMKDVFALIRSRRQSGVLSVERFENGVFEEGEIHFQSGRPMQGFTGKLTGEAALNHMSNWRRVYFAFSTMPSSPSSEIPMHTPPPLPPSSSTFPVHPAPQTPQNFRSPDQSATEPLNDNTGKPVLPTERTTGSLARQNEYNPATLVPYKVSMQQDVMSLSLTRQQRSVYLLVDGHRSVADIARFTAKGVPEVVQIILDLRARNLVSM